MFSFSIKLNTRVCGILLKVYLSLVVEYREASRLFSKKEIENINKHERMKDNIRNTHILLKVLKSLTILTLFLTHSITL